MYTRGTRRKGQYQALISNASATFLELIVFTVQSYADAGSMLGRLPSLCVGIGRPGPAKMFRVYQMSQ